MGEKCPKCDRELIHQIQKTTKKTNTHFIDGDFPFEKNQYYLQKDVRSALGCSLMSGINYNKNGNFLVLFMNAHNSKDNKNNPYYDYYDSETGLYHYTGKGKKGDQTLTGANHYLAASTTNNTTIHLFMQQNVGSNHQYMGQVKLEQVIQTIQTDKNSNPRQVYEFLLCSID